MPEQQLRLGRVSRVRLRHGQNVLTLIQKRSPINISGEVAAISAWRGMNQRDFAEFVMNSPSIAAAYEQDGFYIPYDVVSDTDAHAIRLDLESAEAELASDPERLALLRSYPSQVLPSFDALIRHPALVAAASEVLGPDLMVWSSGLFIKEANSPSFVSWHQDLTY